MKISTAKVIDIKSRKEVTSAVEPKIETEKPVKIVAKKKSQSKLPQAFAIVPFILMITGYLAYQNYDFFLATNINSDVLAGTEIQVTPLLNSLIAEILLLVSAAYTKIASSRSVKALAWMVLITMLIGLGVFMHSSLHSGLSKNDTNVQSLLNQKQDALKAKESYEKDKEQIPADWIGRRSQLQKKIDQERALIAQLDSQLASVKTVSSQNLQAVIIYNSLLRIVAMIVNALLAHSLVGLFQRKK